MTKYLGMHAVKINVPVLLVEENYKLIVLLRNEVIADILNIS